MLGAARKPDPLARARALVGQLGGEWVDPWALGAAALDRASRCGIPVDRAAREVVSDALGWRAIDGQVGAQHRLLVLWHAEVHRWCRVLAGRSVDADALAQEVLFRALRAQALDQRPHRLQARLCSTLLRVLREQERGVQVRRLIPEALWHKRPLTLPLADAVLLADERDARLRLALSALAAEQRVLLWAHHAEGQDQAALAGWSGLGRGTLDRRLGRARQAFGAACRRLGVAGRPGAEAWNPAVLLPRAFAVAEPAADALVQHRRAVWARLGEPVPRGRPRRPLGWVLLTAAVAVALLLAP